MSKQQLTRQGNEGIPQARQQNQRSSSEPATAMVLELLATGRADPHAIAEIVGAHPRASHEIFTLLNGMMGNGFAQEVLALATSRDRTAPPRMDASNFQIAPPRDLEAKMPAMLDAAENESGLGERREVISFDSTGDFYDSRATVDAPHHEEESEAPAKEKRSSWVERARRYNRAHPDLVATFLEATGTRCVDEATGEPDPRKVARWQADHGISADGRIGETTATIAVMYPG